jgi:hypothetical protein
VNYGGRLRKKVTESAEFEQAKEVVERVFRRVGIPCAYQRSDFLRDEQALRDSVRRKRARREQEAAQMAAFEWKQ